MDDCDECGDLRIELTVEESGKPGAGVVGHLSPNTARRLRAALLLSSVDPDRRLDLRPALETPAVNAQRAKVVAALSAGNVDFQI